MEVVSLTSEDETSGHGGTKRFLQGRPLPSIPIDSVATPSDPNNNSHPARYPGFRPHQRRLSQPRVGHHHRGDGTSTPCDSGVSFSSPEGDPPLYASSTVVKSFTGRSSRSKAGRSSKNAKKKRPVASSSVTPAGGGSGNGGGAGVGGGGTGGGGGGGGGAAVAAGGAAGLMSSTSSGVSSSRTSDRLHKRVPHASHAPPKVSQISQHGRSSYMDDPDYMVNPEPVPFMPSNFIRHHGLLPFGYPRSSTMLKKIPIPKRHQDTFGGYEYNFTGQRGVMLHTDRYQFEALRAMEGLNQRDRLLAEMAYLDHLRGVRRRREVVPHRAQIDMFLGGKKIECEERFDIHREIQRLKAMAMPIRARDLFHGRGIVLPPTHMSLAPRIHRGLMEDSDSEEEARISAPASMQRAPGESLALPGLQSPTYERQITLTLGEEPRTRSIVRGKRFNQLPSLAGSKTQTPRAGNLTRSVLRGHSCNMQLHASTPTSLSKTQIPKAVRFEKNSFGLQRDDTNVSKSGQSASNPPTNRSAAWVEEQNKLLSRGPGPRQDGPEKRLSPEAPPPSTEGGARPQAGGRQTSPPKSHTPNPLKGAVHLEVSEEQVSSLRQTFQRLDTDMDGHLQYHQLKSQLPKEFSQQQEYFVKQVYNITHSSGAFFGVDEFMMMSQLTTRVASLTGPAQEAYGKLNFDTLEAYIIKYVELFHNADSSQKGRITVNALMELLGKSQNKAPLPENSPEWNTIMDSLSPDYALQVNRTDYLAHIPLFMYLVPPSSPPPRPQSEEQGLGL